MDKAHVKTDKMLSAIESHLADVYDRAQVDIQRKADAYFEQFVSADEKKRALVEKGKLDADTYERWRKNKIMYGRRFTELKEQLAAEYANVNKTALSYINGELPEVYALNYNSLAPDVDGVGGYSFTLTDANTVKYLATTDDSLLPYKQLDVAKDIAWSTKKINSEVLQGILQGEKITDIAKRLENVTTMEKSAAVRNARTMVTGAQNKGRLDSYARAEADGIILQKEWLATNDGRVRHSHAILDGQLKKQDEAFDNGLMYPGDPNGSPEEVYNCRCAMTAKIISINGVKINENADRADRYTVQDWINKNPEEFDIQQKMWYNKSADKEQYIHYKQRLGSDAPKSVAELQTLKYRHVEAYEELKTFYRYKGRVPEASKADFLTAQAIKNKGIVGSVRVPAAKIDVSNLSVADNHAFRHGCTIEDAKAYIQNAKVSITRYKWDGLHTNFYSLEGATYLNASNKVNTIYAKTDFKKDTSKILEELK